MRLLSWNAFNHRCIIWRRHVLPCLQHLSCITCLTHRDVFIASMSHCNVGFTTDEHCQACVQGTGRPGAPIFRSARSFIRDGRLNRALAVPAFLYSINGQLKFAMQLFFKPTTAKMLGNLKVGVHTLSMARFGSNWLLHHAHIWAVLSS